MVTIDYLNKLSQHMKIGRTYRWDDIIKSISGKIPGEEGFREQQDMLHEATELLEREGCMTSMPSDARRHLRTYTRLKDYVPKNRESALFDNCSVLPTLHSA